MTPNQLQALAETREHLRFAQKSIVKALLEFRQANAKPTKHTSTFHDRAQEIAGNISGTKLKLDILMNDLTR